ncbi:MAG: ABC transporter ATP-binding protein/permease [Atopostipes suicloacalis]|nr:ABC transporter ATP-binding protein/permease [Atopostipes suicloacalis]MDN6730928.1 ABC transporter ATP-binding protein/permease [Atopostipes suicloacalis]
MAKKESTGHLRAQKPGDFWGTVKRLLIYMAKRSWAIFAVVFFAAGAAIISALQPGLLGRATTIIFEGFQEGMALRESGETVSVHPIDFGAVASIVKIFVVLLIIQAVFRYGQNYLTAVLAQRTVYELRQDLKEKLGNLPIKYFDTHSVGDVMSRAVNDMEQIANTLQRSLAEFILAVVTFFAVLIAMLSVDVTMSLIVFASVGLSAIFIAMIAPRSQRKFSEQQKTVGLLNDKVEELYSGHTIVRTYNRELEEVEELEKHSDHLYDASWKAQFYSGIMQPSVNFARDLGVFGITLYGGFGVISGTVPLGNVQAFIQFVNRFSQPIRQVANLANNIQITIAAVERVFETLDHPEMEAIESNKEEKEDTDYIIEFEHVEFGYSDSGLLMTDFNLEVEAGEMVAVVGPTGAGKSTLINLLERFYDVSGGSIRYKGKDVRDMDREELRDKFSMVLQDTWLFNGTIWDNISYGVDHASDEEILEVSKAAYVDDFVRRLPHGYETILNEEGTNISQGQRQLITIARAFLVNPEILILDEATSSVDTRTEVQIQKAMEVVLEGRTSFVVAHRLSTIRDADKIVVMNEGDVIEIGTHDELLEADGFYATLYNAQFLDVDDIDLDDEELAYGRT